MAEQVVSVHDVAHFQPLVTFHFKPIMHLIIESIGTVDMQIELFYADKPQCKSLAVFVFASCITNRGKHNLGGFGYPIPKPKISLTIYK